MHKPLIKNLRMKYKVIHSSKVLHIIKGDSELIISKKRLKRYNLSENIEQIESKLKNIDNDFCNKKHLYSTII